MTIPDSGCFMDDDMSCLPCPPEEEKRILKELTEAAEANLKEGNLYYVLSNKWFMEWQRYTGQDTGDYLFDVKSAGSNNFNGVLLEASYRPGQIDNSHLVLVGSDVDGNDLEIQRTMEEMRDYVLVPQEVWKKLHNWYKGGPALPRRLISQGGDQYKNFAVEVYLLSLQLIDSRNNKQFVIRISKKASIRELYYRVCTLLGLDQEKVHIWDYFEREKHVLLSISDKTLEDATLQMDHHILLEMKNDMFQPSGSGTDSTGNELALVAIEPSRSSVTIAGGPTLSNGHSKGYTSNLMNGSSLTSPLTDGASGYDPLTKTVTKDEGGGLAGLQNLGNTCFMNSALQCLVHTPPLVEYFLEDYTVEINKLNPLGLHGELAIAFGELLRKLWSSGRVPIAPRAFKGKLARFAPQFSGYNQHDSQELLAFLLDGLHEDLNRVKNKPYVEAKDANGRPDEEVANECWENHKARNDSVIVDVCQGQYKSTLVCPVCSKISVTFDPFMYLSLPLPSTVTRSMTVTVFYGDGSGLPMPFTVSVSKHGCLKDLIQVLSNDCCLRTGETLLLAEVYCHRIYRYLGNPFEPLSTIKDDDHIVAYRVPKMEGLTRLEILHRSKEKYTSDISIGGDSKLSRTPLVTCIADGPLTGADIQPLVHMVLAPLSRTPSSIPLSQVPDIKKNVRINAYRPVNSSNSDAVMKDQSTNSMEVEQIANGGEPSFHISLTDDKGLLRDPIDSNVVFKQGQPIRVLLEWSDRERELYDLSYLENLPEVHKSGGFSVKKTRQEPISLFSCLDAFLKEEPLGPDDMWYCPTCKEHRQASKKLDLWRLPEILVFHLKRFSYSRYLKNKLDTFVNFPIHNLDLSKYARNSGDPSLSYTYELYAISNHYGGLGGGHYSAYAKVTEGGERWYHFDDSHVSSVSEDEIKTSAAYVLFYRRVKPAEKTVLVGESSHM